MNGLDCTVKDHWKTCTLVDNLGMGLYSSSSQSIGCGILTIQPSDRREMCREATGSPPPHVGCSCRLYTLLATIAGGEVSSVRQLTGATFVIGRRWERHERRLAVGRVEERESSGGKGKRERGENFFGSTWQPLYGKKRKEISVVIGALNREGGGV